MSGPHTRPKVRVIRESYVGYTVCSSHYWVLRTQGPIVSGALTLKWNCRVCGRIVKAVIYPPEVGA